MTKQSIPDVTKALLAALGVSLMVAIPALAAPLGFAGRTATTKFAMGTGHGLPRGAEPLTGQQLFELYVGKTWQWAKGGGYFGPHGQFRARTVSDNDVTLAAGTWGVSDNGRMCFRAVWSKSSGSSRANTCFDHAAVGADIYQRRVPDGAWYVFRHGVPVETDQYNKLIAKDLVSAAAVTSKGGDDR
ncbi:MAG TPA: DUF995 domain-containing protein [Devosia sp.]|jgi:hypothetical protein|uniref:DUF995 domain-containing protein n=1 Tax=Devosia sp. TaxID=1871048 RepID=UPI002DDD4ABB|nr:DUF995 domain-containing protein [Devosia sp.]HEV2516785.1 DUF995 domain-containing protein [Devosia sp.]